MTTTLELQALTILEAALETEHGLVLRTNEPLRARATLYRFRKDSHNPELNALSIRFSPDDPEHELWILRRGSDAEA